MQRTGPDTLVAGIGNVFLGDDGFGPEVVRRLVAGGPVPGARVVDYGIRGMHLAFDLLDGCDVLVLVDTMRFGDAPGDLTVLEVSEDDLGSGTFDPHGMSPVALLANLHQLGGTLPRTYVVGCRPGDLGDRMGLSDPVAAAVPRAVAAVHRLLANRAVV